MRAIIVEDDDKNYQALCIKLQLCCPEVQVIGHAATCTDAIALINAAKPDLLFLDIELPDGQGFDILKAIRPLHPAIIFVTGYQEHIMRAFEFSAIHFLSKPVDPIQLKLSVEKARERNHIQLLAEQYEIFEEQRKGRNAGKIALSNQDVIIFKELDEVVFLEGNGGKTLFSFKDYTMEIARTLADYARMFQDIPFLMRSAKSHIINLNEVKYFQRAEMSFLMSNGKQTYLGDAYRSAVLEQLEQFCKPDHSWKPRLSLADQRLIAYPYINEIYYLEAEGAFTRFFLKGFTKPLLVSQNIGKFEQIPGLVRVHKSYMVQTEAIVSIARESKLLTLANGASVPLSEEGKKRVLETIGR